MTALGPLTTTFTAPSSCTTTTPQIYEIWSNTPPHYVQGPLLTSANSNCFPSQYDASPSKYYSPGFCPHGYTAACSSSHTLPTKGATETAVTCCPSGVLSYACLGSGTLASYGCTAALGNAIATVGVTVITEGTVSGYKVVTKTDGGFAAHSIQVRFQESDSMPFTANTNPSRTTAPGNPPPTGSPGADNTFTLPTGKLPSETGAPAGTSGGGMSTATAIGIGVGSTVAALTIIGGLCLFFFLRWRRKRNPPPVPPKSPTIGRNSTYTFKGTIALPPYELSEDVASPRHTRHMSKSTAPYELSEVGSPRRFTGMTDYKEEGTAPYELSEEASLKHKSIKSLKSNRSLTSARARSGSEEGGSQRGVPAELEAPAVPKLLRQTTPDSQTSNSWSSRQRTEVMPTPWI